MIMGSFNNRGLRCSRKLSFTSVWCVLLGFLTGISSAGGADVPIEPLLQKYCLGCHNETDAEAGLSLQTFDSLRKGGDSGSVLAEDLRNSRLFKVLAPDAEDLMPPVDSAQPTAKERALLRQWVLSGARLNPVAMAQPDVPDLHPQHGRSPALFALAASSGAQLIAEGGEGYVQIRSAADGSVVWRRDVEGRVTEVSFSRDEDWLIVAAGRAGISGRAMILSAADGGVVREFAGHTDILYTAQLSPDSRLLATAGYDRRIVLHHVDGQENPRILTGHNGAVFSVGFSSSGDVLCSASGDGTVKVWETLSGRRLDTLSQPRAEQYSVHVSRDDRRIYAAGADNRIRVWQLTSRATQQINPLEVAQFAHEQPINLLVYSADHQYLASSADDGTVRVWSAWPLRPIVSLPARRKTIMAMTFLGQSQLLVGHRDGSLERIDITARSGDRVAAPTKTTDRAVTAELPLTLHELTETDSNDVPKMAQPVALPFRIKGTMTAESGRDADADCYRFRAAAGQKLILEIRAQRDKSPLDSRIEVLTADGQPIVRTVLQAVRDSYFTFRGKDSGTVDDFRVFNWQEMELNQYLYSDGEVVRLWLYPRGPDSGFMVYPGFGKRHTFFGTTPTAHALQAPCFIVRPQAPDAPVVANGLPTFPIYYENDDDPRRELGSDSRLHFTAPEDGEYVVRVTDARGFSGPDYKYELTVRTPQPAYKVTMPRNLKLALQPGTGREMTFTAQRIDGYEGPIVIDASHVPDGFAFSGTITIQRDQSRAMGIIYAKAGATEPTEDQVKAIRFHATTESVGDQEVGSLAEIKLTAEPKLRVRIGKSTEEADASQEIGTALTIRPGETIRAMVKLDRINHGGVVSFGKEDAGRNLPHGVYVDNIGLNGLLLLSEQSQREFFITATKWVPPGTSTFHLKSNVDGITSFPVTLTVLPAEAQAEDSATAAIRP